MASESLPGESRRLPRVIVMGAGESRRLPRVIVMGAGPVGLAIAGALHDRGFPVKVYEKRAGSYSSGGVIQLHVEGLTALWFVH